MIYQKDEKISFYDLDANGDVKLSALLRHINEAAFYNAEELGIGFEKTLKIDLAFIIQRIGLRIFKMPVLKQKVVIRTWPGEITRSAFKRYGAICNEEGNKLIEWESLWVLINVNERRIKRPNTFPIEIAPYGKKGVEIETRKIVLPKEKELNTSYKHTVQFSELDINMHMNNAIYGDLIANVLALNTALPSVKAWKDVQFNYVNEAKLSDEVVVNCYQSNDSLYITGNIEEKTIFTAAIRYGE